MTVLMPTCNRARIVTHTLSGLEAQTYKDFEVLLVTKPNDLETIKIAKKYRGPLSIRVLCQKRNGLMNAYNEGILDVNRDVIVFMDDDAVPKTDCIEQHLRTYQRLDVSAVSGEVIPASMKGTIVTPLEGLSEITTAYNEPELLRTLGAKLWNRPLEGQEGYLAYISKAGYSQKDIYVDRRDIVPSLPCMAANMSIVTSALDGLEIPTSFLKRGISFEQAIGWHMWRTGRKMVFNGKAVVYHLRHGTTMSRLLGMGDAVQAAVENELMFFYLASEGERLSIMHRIVSLGYYALVHTKKLKRNFRTETCALKGMWIGNEMGLKWTISRKIKGSYLPVHDTVFR